MITPFLMLGDKADVLHALRVFGSQRDMESFLRHVSHTLADIFSDTFMKRLRDYDEGDAMRFALESITEDFSMHYQLGPNTYDLERLAADIVTCEPYRQHIKKLEQVRAASLHKAGYA